MLKKDKQKVLGERFDDERIKSFLALTVDGEHGDFLLLEKAYRGMVAENFASFVQFFVDSGHDINTKNEHGLSFLAVLQQHRHANASI